MTRRPARSPEVFLRAEASSHEPQINWREFVNRADGISEIEGKRRRSVPSELGRERVSNSCRKTVSKKISIQMSSLVARFRFTAMKANYETRRKEQP